MITLEKASNDLEKNAMILAGRKVRTIIGICGAAVTLIYGWLVFSGNDFLKVANNLGPEFVQRLAMAIYLLAWVQGPLSDLDAQELAYPDTPTRVTPLEMAVIAAITAGFVALCACVTKGWFGVGLPLLVFWLVNVAGTALLWRILARKIGEFDQHYRNAGNTAARVRLAFVREFMLGDWQKWRMALGAALAMGVWIFEATPLKGVIAARLSLEGSLLRSLLFLGFVLVVEAWIWKKRLERDGQLEGVKEVMAALAPN
jgi:hypothetical protein